MSYGERWNSNSLTSYIEFGSTTKVFKFAEMPNLSTTWKLSIRDHNLGGTLKATGVLFDSSSMWSYMPPSDF